MFSCTQRKTDRRETTIIVWSKFKHITKRKEGFKSDPKKQEQRLGVETYSYGANKIKSV